MKFKVVGKRLILTDYSHEITEGENSFDTVEISVPRYHDDCDLSTLSFRFSEISEDGENSAVQVLHHEKCDEKYIYLKGTITSVFSAITGNVIFMLTGVSGENVVAKFQSTPYTISDDISLTSLPNETTAEQLFNQAQLEAQKAMDAAAETRKMLDEFTIDVASESTLGGIKSGGDISVSESGKVTVQSVNGKALGKSVPENAVFTDTVYTLPKATTEILGGVRVDGTSVITDKNGIISAVGGKGSDGKIVLPIASEEILGGVKVDGKTITASEDGTISTSDSENLKIEIADVKSSQKSISNLAVQIAHPNNYLIYDDLGKPSVMVAIPKFYLDEVIDGASHTVHPAFIVDGVEQDVIYISKYQNIVENGRAYSLPMKAPAVNINFDQAWNYCKNKGVGWHLITNAEWAAIALWCKKNGTIPKGNNNYGKDVSEIKLPQKAIPAAYGSDGKTNITLTGSGRENWYHDRTFAGIADLNGNVWEWCSGFRIVNGEIQILENNDAADWNNSISADSTLWRTILQNGSLSEPNAVNALKYTDFEGTTFPKIKSNAEANSGGANLAISLAIIPDFGATSPSDFDDEVWISSNYECMPMRGNCFRNGPKSGIFSLLINSKRISLHPNVGFRCAYYGN